MIDISLITTRRADEGAWLEVLNPVTNQPVGAKILVAGVDSVAYREAQRKISNRRLAAMSRRGSRYKVSAEEVEAEGLELLTTCIMDWEGISENGEKLDCNQDNAKRLFAAAPWLKEQVDEFIGDRSHFLDS